MNDTRYAENYISARIHGRSRQKIFQELYRKGVDRTSAAAAWEEVSSLEQPDERKMIRTEILKKYDPGAELSEKEMRRLLGRFARRGFARRIFPRYWMNWISQRCFIENNSNKNNRKT